MDGEAKPDLTFLNFRIDKVHLVQKRRSKIVKYSVGSHRDTATRQRD